MLPGWLEGFLFMLVFLMAMLSMVVVTVACMAFIWLVKRTFKAPMEK